MENLFLGHFAATTAPGIVAKVKTPLEPLILDDEGDAGQLAPLLAEAEIVVRHILACRVPTRGAPEEGHSLQRFGHEPAMDLTQVREFR